MWLSISLAVLAVAVFIYSFSWQIREIPLVPRVIIAGVRVLILLLLLICVFRPALSKKSVSPYADGGHLFFFIDSSHSMMQDDCGMGPVTRYDLCVQAAQRIANEHENYTPHYLYFNGEGVSDVNYTSTCSVLPTDLTIPLRYLSSLPYAPQSYSVVFSDGCHTAPTSLENACREYSVSKSVEINAVGVHTINEKTPYIAITNISLPAHCWKNDTINLTTDIIYKNITGEATISLLRDGQRIQEKSVSLSGVYARVSFTLIPQDHGTHSYTIRVTASGFNDITAEATAAMHISHRTYNVLYMEGSSFNPYNKSIVYTNVPAALEKTDDIFCTVLIDSQVLDIVHNATEKLVEDPVYGYPLTLEGLKKYDVIINSDIPRESFSSIQIDNTAKFVEEFGGGFVMIGGYTAFGAGHWDETRLDRISPVDMDSDISYNEKFTWEFTKEGVRHPIMQIAENPEENRKILKSMPHFYGYNNSLRTKPNAVTLATHPTKKTTLGEKMPILAVQEIGRGRCMAFMSDTTYLWGMDFEDHWGTPIGAEIYDRSNEYYQKFWQNAVRWLGRNSLRHHLSTYYITTDKTFYQNGEKACVMYHDTRPLTSTNAISLEVHHTDGKKESFPLRQTHIPHIYSAEISLYRTGIVVCTVSRTDTHNAPVSFPLYVQPDIKELFNTTPQKSTLQMIANAGNGKVVSYNESLHFPDTVAKSTLHQKTDEEKSDVWTTPWTIATILFLLTIEWIIRRMGGMA